MKYGQEVIFYFYLQWFNKAIEVLRNTGCQRAFIDATEGGVNRGN